MKKILILILAFLMSFMLIACNNEKSSSAVLSEDTTAAEEDNDNEDAQDDSNVQLSDESMVISDEEGGITAIGGAWPENEYTKLIPVPEFGALSFTNITEEEGFIAQVGGATIEDTKNYVEKLKDEGFTKNSESFDGTGLGDLESFTYTAENKDGVVVTIDYALEIFMVQVSN